MFSATVSPAKGWTIWKVRAMPRRARRCGASAVTSCPSNRTCPSLGVRKPEIIPNRVVLPAPFGPMSPVIEPAGTASEA